MNGNNQNYPNNQACPVCQSTSNAFVSGAAVGAVIGVVLGLLFSPGTGEQNRKAAMKAATHTKKFLDEEAEEAVEAVSEFAEDTTDFIHQVEKKAAPIKRQAAKYAAEALDTIEDSARDTRKRFFKGVKV